MIFKKSQSCRKLPSWDKLKKSAKIATLGQVGLKSIEGQKWVIKNRQKKNWLKFSEWVG